MKKHLSIKIYGQVQGVGFRYYTREKAQELALFGFVHNEPDNTVYVEMEGEEKNLKNFLEWCHLGPEAARVEKVEFAFSEGQKKFDEFRVI